jgi:hypothetical protein
MVFFDAQRILVASYSAAGSRALPGALAASAIPTGQIVVAPPREVLQAA